MESEIIHTGTGVKAADVSRALRNITAGFRPVAILCVRNLPFSLLVLLSSLGAIWAVFMLLG